MCFVEAGQDGAAPGIDDMGVRAGKRIHFSLGTDGQDAIARHGERGGARVRLVHRQHPRIADDKARFGLHGVFLDGFRSPGAIARGRT
jgi:hypothetical protein